MRPAMTSWAPSHRTSVTPPNMTVMIRAVMTARAFMRWIEVAKDASTAASKRPMAVASRPKAWTVSTASTFSPAEATASAKASCVLTVRRRTIRPKKNSGTISTGTISTTMPVSLGETKNSRMTAPISVSRLRSA